MTSTTLQSHPLTRPDGSSTLTTPLFTILASVNGPLEVQRRDELPEEAAIEVNIRFSSGVGGPRERWLESVLSTLLKEVLLVGLMPRRMVQVSLLVSNEALGRRVRGGVRDVAVIPAVVNAAFAALVDGGLPLKSSVVAGLGVVKGDGEVVVGDVSEKDLIGCKSVHGMAFNSHGDLLLDESAGMFGLEQWQEVVRRLKEVATSVIAVTGEDESMVNGNAEAVPWLRKALEDDVQRAGAWREAG